MKHKQKWILNICLIGKCANVPKFGTERWREKVRKYFWKLIVCFLGIMVFLGVHLDVTQAATAGYTEVKHKWLTASCGTCNGDGKEVCDVCDGTGVTFYSLVTGTPAYGKTYLKFCGCDDCGGSGYNDSYYHVYYLEETAPYQTIVMESYDDGFVTGSGNGDGDCPTCNGTGVLHRCVNTGCSYSYYGIWQGTSEYTDVCYEIPNTYTITFYPNGGELLDLGTNLNNGTNNNSVSLSFQSTNYSDMSGDIPIRKGYTFLGWYTSSVGGIQVYDANGDCTNEGTYRKNDKYVYADNLKLYAHWEQNKYKVTYDANGGTTTAKTVETYYGENVDLSVKAEKEGVIFVGWSMESDGRKPLNSLSMPDLATSENTDYSNDWELTLYAVYTISVSDVANHTYPDYQAVKEEEVYLVVWLSGNTSTYKMYPLKYTRDSNIMVYQYILGNTNISSFVGSKSYSYQVIAFDNAGNHTVLYEGGSGTGGQNPPDFPIEEKFPQVVGHYRYDVIAKEWIWFDSVTEVVASGELFTPEYTTAPKGYQEAEIDSAYIVTGAASKKAYYMPIEYTLNFDANGGSVSTTSKNIYYGDVYGELPMPEWKGHTFLGWYTKKDSGNVVTAAMKYETVGNSTIYAHWETNKYNVIYDYWTNGGASVSVDADQVLYGTDVDLNVTAKKEGWIFVGWNINPEATTGLSTYQMSDADVILYAIYKKDITATFIDGENHNSRTQTYTIYNQQTSCTAKIPKVTLMSDWTSLGWSMDTKADATVSVSENVEYELMEDTVLYGCYVRDVTLSYDTNGSLSKIQSQTKQQYFNAFGNYKHPEFQVAGAPSMTEHSFVQWEELSGNTVVNAYLPNQEFVIMKDTLLTARWDKIPEIEAYDRYFTTEEAANGEITAERLLEKVIAADKEDGVLVNGTDVIIKDYKASDFLSEGEIEITYQATDSFGNVAEKTITVHIVDITVKKNPRERYVRFIGTEFFTNASGGLLSAEKGGLEETSIWRTTDSYRNLLEQVLDNTKSNQETKIIEYLGTSMEVTIAGTGEWEQQEETWVFTKSDMEEVKEFVNTYGYGNIKEPDALKRFLELFGSCCTEN